MAAIPQTSCTAKQSCVSLTGYCSGKPGSEQWLKKSRFAGHKQRSLTVYRYVKIFHRNEMTSEGQGRKPTTFQLSIRRVSFIQGYLVTERMPPCCSPHPDHLAMPRQRSIGSVVERPGNKDNPASGHLDQWFSNMGFSRHLAMKAFIGILTRPVLLCLK
jgi:hypothetical protein